MEQTLASLASLNPTMVLGLMLWVIPWKAWALWLAARRGDLWWFLGLFIINTLAILEILYIFFVAKQSDKRDDGNTAPMHE